MKKKLLKLALCAAALLPMGAWAAIEEVFSVNYAELATENITSGESPQITADKTTTQSVTIGGTNYTTYAFYYGEVLPKNDVWVNRDNIYFRYKDNNTIGLYHNSATVFAVKNVTAGDIVKIAYIGTAITQDVVINATLSATTETFTHNFNYYGARSLNYTEYSMTATADGTVAVMLPGGYLVGKISVVREVPDPTVSTTTIWTFNNLTDVINTNQFIADDEGNNNLYANCKSGTNSTLRTFTPTELASPQTLVFGDGYTIKVSKVLNINGNIRYPNNLPEETTATTITGDYGQGFLAFDTPVEGTLYVYMKSAAEAQKNLRIYHSQNVSGGKITAAVSNVPSSNSTDLLEASYTSTAAGTFFFGLTAGGANSSIYAARFVPTSEKKDEWIYIGSTGYATWGNNSGKDIIELPTGLTAYAAKAGTNSVTLTSLDKMRRGQAYVVKGTPETNYGLTYDGTESVGVEYNGGDMQRVSADMENFAPTNGETGDALRNRYILASDNGVAKFFVPSGSGTLKKGKAYLQTSKTLTPTAGSKGIEMIFEDETTGIQNVAPSSVANGKYYNLMGVEVAHPTKGVYIVNGKKVVVK